MIFVSRERIAFCRRGSNKFRKIILSTARSAALRSALSAKSPSQKIPRVPGMRTTTRATRYEWKKVPNGIVELRLWWYWRKFRGKSGHRLAASRCHSCENPKTRRYCTPGTTYIFACAHTRARVDVSNFIIRMFWPERSDDHVVRSEENDFFSSRVTHVALVSWQFDTKRAIILD